MHRRAWEEIPTTAPRRRGGVRASPPRRGAVCRTQTRPSSRSCTRPTGRCASRAFRTTNGWSPCTSTRSRSTPDCGTLYTMHPARCGSCTPRDGSRRVRDRTRRACRPHTKSGGTSASGFRGLATRVLVVHPIAARHFAGITFVAGRMLLLQNAAFSGRRMLPAIPAAQRPKIWVLLNVAFLHDTRGNHGGREAIDENNRKGEIDQAHTQKKPLRF